MTTRVLLADDHRLMREGLRGLLEKHSECEVVGEVDDGRAAVQMATTLRPDVVIMDIGMPSLNGIEATRQIVCEHPEIKIIALSMHTNRRMVAEMLYAGASGYVSKLSAFDEVVRAVEAVVKGERYLSPSMASSLVDALVGRRPLPTDSAFSSLTPREREVLQLLAEGKTSKEIASILRISARTVDVHRKHIMDKLDMESVADLTRYAIREGLIGLDD